MAQVDINEDALVAAVAEKIAQRMVGDAGFIQRLASATAGGLLSLQQLREAYDAGVTKALTAKIAEAAKQIDTLIDGSRLRRAVADAETEAERRLGAAAQEIVNASKIRMQRTLKQAVAELLKDRVDDLVAKLMTPKASA